MEGLKKSGIFHLGGGGRQKSIFSFGFLSYKPCLEHCILHRLIYFLLYLGGVPFFSFDPGRGFLQSVQKQNEIMRAE